MIIDSSALIAIVFQEPGYAKVLRALETAEWIGIGSPTLAEAAIVVGNRLGFERLWIVHRFLQEFDIAVLAFEQPHWVEAATAYERFGRARHAAGLNFGDCLSYATARLADRPLLCIGGDFAKTDLPIVTL